MRVQGHVAGGTLVAAAAVAWLRPPADVADRLMVLGAFAGGCPDLDYLYYAVSRRRLRVENDFHHHTWVSHTFPFHALIALALGAGLAVAGVSHAWWYAVVLFAGAATHLVQDMYGSGDGIMAFYPVNRRMVGWALTGTHGPDWMRDYLRSTAYRVELVTNACAVFAVLWYLTQRP